MSTNNDARDGMKGTEKQTSTLQTIHHHSLSFFGMACGTWWDVVFWDFFLGCWVLWDIIDQSVKILKNKTKWIKIPGVDKNELRLHVFSKSLSGDAKKWWSNEMVPNDLDNGTDYLEFLYWLALKFDNYWEIDKNAQNGLWEFYVNERTKGTIGDLNDEPRNKNYKKTCSDSFYKPYLDAHDGKDIYEIIDREYSPIPVPARRDISNPDELCKTKEFTVI
ncbi:hypothetical protein Tco_1042512 [Tanacetum coccineum]|uniref:Uncharacterized protein n=1 Tax=Tanacetum coccineum TaxID=301880 RepID=A0ABQ5GLM6_9ASTR